MPRAKPRRGWKDPSDWPPPKFAFTPTARTELTRLGFSEASIDYFEYVLARVRTTANVDFPTVAEQLAGARQVKDRATALLTALVELDASTAMSIPSALRRTGVPELNLDLFMDEIRNLVRALDVFMSFAPKKRKTRRNFDVLTSTVRRAMENDDLEFNSRPRGAAAVAIQICRGAIGAHTSEPRNQVRKALKRRGGYGT